MPEISRVIKIGRSIYFAVTPRIATRLAIKAGDRMIIETDGAQMYCAPLRIDELIRLAPRARKRTKAFAAGARAGNQEKGVKGQIERKQP